MTAIYKRELKTFFTTVTGWLFIAAHICLAGLYFFAINLLSGYSNVGQSFSSILFLLLLSTPILSMRMLAEERKQKTDQLILTSPVSIGGIVAGKYLAMATVFTLPVAVMALFPLILSRYGTVPMGESYTALLAYYLFGLTCLAIGLFISSITESQIIALCLICLVGMFLLYRQILLLSLDDQEGRLLGVNVTQIRLIVLLIATLAASSVISMTGLISFISLLAPHGARLLFKNNRLSTMLFSGLLGGCLLTLGDIFARSIASTELPVSIFTSLLGAPFLIYLCIRRKPLQ